MFVVEVFVFNGDCVGGVVSGDFVDVGDFVDFFFDGYFVVVVGYVFDGVVFDCYDLFFFFEYILSLYFFWGIM